MRTHANANTPTHTQVTHTNANVRLWRAQHRRQQAQLLGARALLEDRWQLHRDREAPDALQDGSWENGEVPGDKTKTVGGRDARIY